MRDPELLAEVVRSGFVESRHRGSVVVLGRDGEVVASAGDIDTPFFPRSANKPLQAVGMLGAGLAAADAELAIIAASHRGEPMHVIEVRRLLTRAGLDADALACPPGYPLSERARAAAVRAGEGPSRLFANCSGKHAGMLLTCQANGWPTEGYQGPKHPLQRALRATVADLAAEPVVGYGVDGCGAPVFALSPRGLAGAFLRLVQAEPGTAEHAVVAAMRSNPELVSGTGEDALDTRLMRAVPGLVSKGGAEGVLAVAVPGRGAVVIKIEDGARRPLAAVAVSALCRLGVDALEIDVPVLGGGTRVGGVCAVW